MIRLKAVCFLGLLSLSSAWEPGFLAAIGSESPAPNTESGQSNRSGTPLLSSGILPLQPRLTLEDSLIDLETLLDNWEQDSLTLWRELVGLQTIVEELKSTLTASEKLCEGLSLSLITAESKIQSLSRQNKALWIGGAIVAVLAFCGGAWVGHSLSH